MRIGIVCCPTIGGSGVVATELGKALADKGHKVHFITYDQPVRLSELGQNMFYHEVMVSQYHCSNTLLTNWCLPVSWLML